ncbi:MAG: hypothetical protein CMK98_13830 [Pseudomonas sp.]|nr:hypothetical protein [Pseudomonas sp.]
MSGDQTPEHLLAGHLRSEHWNAQHDGWVECMCGEPYTAEHQLAALRTAGFELMQWREVPGFPAYEVSDHGDVRSRKWAASRYLNPTLSHGYPTVRLRRDGKDHSLRVHRLVLLAFSGACPPGQEVRHLDGDAMNNRLSNLRYGTSSENHADTVVHGSHHQASKTHCPQGHPYSGSNLILTTKPDGSKYRRCRECKNAAARAKYAADAAEAGQ